MPHTTSIGSCNDLLLYITKPFPELVGGEFLSIKPILQWNLIIVVAIFLGLNVYVVMVFSGLIVGLNKGNVPVVDSM